MAKAKHKPTKAQGSTADAKKRKMQHFQRVSLSSTTSHQQSQKKRKLADSQEQQQQAWKGKKKNDNNHQQELHQRPTIPYQRKDRILLIGEGDFSFARSLYEHHRCKSVFATCYDSQDTLLEKYHGQAEENIKKFLDCGDGDEEQVKEKTGFAIDSERSERAEEDIKRKKNTRKVLYSVDARKLGSNVGGGKDIRKGIPPRQRRKTLDFQWNKTKDSSSKGKGEDDGPWDIISFNFPHVGGLSTDVNRQVRANQELLVSFFKACVPLLSRQGQSDDEDKNNFEDDVEEYPTDSEEESDFENESDDNQQIRTVPRHSGQIIVTLFEGEPYTLWNIKDLARHAGLVVVTSFRFPWKSYPGYSHARTLGVVESRKHRHDNDDHRKSEGTGGGWKGEDREARSYVFEVKDTQQQGSKGKGNKKKGGSDSDSSDGE
ncbi:hypothetical protein UA08_02645 [Talaromyces atroroseus]|uniref:25S rRNA (uridine-N(3))-methyltransferase BMT5-like domain-containing protein n=1 Tax=Talaromyces atroroseus TaxID=1441469 RepID=A0A225B7M9_TALAT|nr:hypothetical protein UA08_02645 [Talaromyces atroroseus]OKL61937.1 hypothetical protein UA08_02645 [Talaromyces atroroseus]